MPKKPSQKQSAADVWENHAAWYDERHGRSGDMHHQQIVIPAVLRHLRLHPDLKVLDCCCGQGVLGRALQAQGVSVFGVDGSPSLIAKAQSYASDGETYVCGDAHNLSAVVPQQDFDAACCILAVQDLDPLHTVFTGIARHLQDDADFIVVMTHPCFRVPKHSDWEFDRTSQQQARKVDQYLSAEALPIQIGHGQNASQSMHYHRPLQTYLRELGKAGFAVLDCEELITTKRGTDGSRSQAEDRAQREIPMFLLLHARKLHA